MVSRRQRMDEGTIIPAKPATIDELRPYLSQWPEMWKLADRDVELGRRLTVSLEPFLLDLLQQRLADKTFARHRDPIEMLGGEIIRRRYDDPDLAKQPINELLSSLIEEEGGHTDLAADHRDRAACFRRDLPKAISVPSAAQPLKIDQNLPTNSAKEPFSLRTPCRLSDREGTSIASRKTYALNLRGNRPVALTLKGIRGARQAVRGSALTIQCAGCRNPPAFSWQFHGLRSLAWTAHEITNVGPRESGRQSHTCTAQRQIQDSRQQSGQNLMQRHQH